MPGVPADRQLPLALGLLVAVIEKLSPAEAQREAGQHCEGHQGAEFHGQSRLTHTTPCDGIDAVKR